MGIERRKFKRVLFTIEDGIIGSFSPPGQEENDVDARVMNISEGGVQLRFKPILNNRIKVGDRLLLTEIKGRDSEQIIVNVDAEVKWVSDDKLTNDIGLGLEFIEVFEKSNSLNEFVEFWNLQRIEN